MVHPSTRRGARLAALSSPNDRSSCTLCSIFVPATAGAQTLRDQVIKNGVSEEIIIGEYPAVSLRDLAASAEAVVHVSIRNTDTFLSGDGMAILTDYRATVIDVIRANDESRLGAGDVLTVRRLGGTLHVEGRKVVSNESGFPQFSNGREYILFLRAGAGHPYELTAGPRSAFRVDEGSVIPIATSSERIPVLLPLFVHEVKGVQTADLSRPQQR